MRLMDKISNRQRAGFMRSKSGQKGFTLVELMVVVAVIAVLAVISMPDFSWKSNMRLRGTARDIYGIMSTARMEAIKRHVNVTVHFCTPTDPDCTPNPAGLGYYTMFLDDGTSIPVAGGIAQDELPNGSEPVLVADTVLPENVFFSPNTPREAGGTEADGVTFGNNNTLVFSPRGLPINTFNTSFGPGRVGIRVTDANGTPLHDKMITVSSAGRVIVEDIEGVGP